MAKKLNKAAQAARDAMIQRVREEAAAPFERMFEDAKAMLRDLEQDVEDCQRSRNAMILAFTLAAALIATAVTYAVMADNRPVSIHVTPPINTPIVAYTPNGWHQAYVDISGNIRSMENGQRIKNATSWMKP
jgi:hypothetical protein